MLQGGLLRNELGEDWYFSGASAGHNDHRVCMAHHCAVHAEMRVVHSIPFSGVRCAMADLYSEDYESQTKILVLSNATFEDVVRLLRSNDISYNDMLNWCEQNKTKQ